MANIWVHADALALAAFGDPVVKFNSSGQVDDYLLDWDFHKAPGRGVLLFVHRGRSAHQAQLLLDVNAAVAAWVEGYEREGRVAPVRFASAALDAGGGGAICDFREHQPLQLPAVCLVEFDADRHLQQHIMKEQGAMFSVEGMLAFTNHWVVPILLAGYGMLPFLEFTRAVAKPGRFRRDHKGQLDPPKTDHSNMLGVSRWGNF